MSNCERLWIDKETKELLKAIQKQFAKDFKVKVPMSRITKKALNKYYRDIHMKVRI